MIPETLINYVRIYLRAVDPRAVLAVGQRQDGQWDSVHARLPFMDEPPCYPGKMRPVGYVTRDAIARATVWEAAR